MTNAVAVDFETHYDETRDIRSMGAIAYLRHPDTDIYMVSLYGDGVEYVGPPEAAPWDQIAGRPWISHNAAFDRAVYAELHRRRPGYYVQAPVEWDCTADMVAAGQQCKRSLADAMKILEGVRVSKTMRDEMRGVKWTDLDDAKKQALLNYALDDARYCHLLWDKYSGDWPEFERKLSRHTATMIQRGWAVDVPRIEEGIERLTAAKFDTEKLIPWVGELDEKGKEIPITSTKRIGLECRKLDIPAPKSTDTKSPVWEAWEEEYSPRAPFVAAIQTWRKINRTLTVLKAMRARTVDGVCYYELKFAGAPHTRRWSGGWETKDTTQTSAAFNIQNLPKKPVEGVDVRSCFVARPGHKLIVSDLAQIEARALLWIAGDEAMLSRLRAGEDMYEAHARVTMGYSDPRPLSEVDPGKRQLAKIRVLGLGYGLGAAKLLDTARQYGLTLSATEAETTVSDFRRTNPKIVAIWNVLKGALSRHAVDGRLEIVLPSGRTIRYFNVRRDGFGYSGIVERGAAEKKLWHGLQCENLIQGTCRDLLGDRILALEDAGHPLVAHIHDETVCEVPDEGVEVRLGEISRIMSTAPEWAPGLPVQSKPEIMDRYTKK